MFPKPLPVDRACEALALSGFSRLSGYPWQNPQQPDWAAFAGSWDDLALDTFMADGGRYRYRRYGALRLAAHRLVRRPHQAHYQDLAFNPLNGGIARWFAPMSDAAATAPPLLSAADTLGEMLDVLTPVPPAAGWDVEAHQFRILATADQLGQPTPEGLHRDGRQWVFILLVARHNIAGGETLIANLAGDTLARFTLMQPGEAVLLDDQRVYHATSPLQPIDPTRPAWRDALVLTFAPA